MARIRGIGTAQHARRRAIRPLDSILPTSFANLQQWLRADLGFTVVSDDLSALADQSGNSKDMDQPVSADRPLYTGVTLGAQQAWEMDGSEHLELATPGLNVAAGKHTLIFVIHPTVVTGSNLFLFRCGLQVGLVLTLDEFGVSDGSARNFNVSPVAEEQIVAFQLNSATASKLYKNGVQIGDAVAYTDDALIANYGLGASFSGANAITGKMAEVIVYSPALSDADLAELTSDYLQPRYGL